MAKFHKPGLAPLHFKRNKKKIRKLRQKRNFDSVGTPDFEAIKDTVDLSVYIYDANKLCTFYFVVTLCTADHYISLQLCKQCMKKKNSR